MQANLVRALRVGLPVAVILGTMQVAHGGGPDTDGDGIADAFDNCTLAANPDQRDTDGDGFGNFCDADFNGDLIVNLQDLLYFRGAFLTADPDGDLNGDGGVNLLDLLLLRDMFLRPPGPSCSNNSFPSFAGIIHDCTERQPCEVTLLVDDNDPGDTHYFNLTQITPLFVANVRDSSGNPLSVGDVIPSDNIVIFDPVDDVWAASDDTRPDVLKFTVTDDCNATSVESINIWFNVQNVDDPPGGVSDIEYSVRYPTSQDPGIQFIEFSDNDDDEVEIVFNTVPDSSLGYFEDHNGQPISAGGVFFCGLLCRNIKFIPSATAPTNAFLGNATYQIRDANTTAMLASETRTISVYRDPRDDLLLDASSTSFTFDEGNETVTTLTVTILQPDLPEDAIPDMKLGLADPVVVAPKPPYCGVDIDDPEYRGGWPRVIARDNMPGHRSGVVFTPTSYRYDIGACSTDCTGPIWYPFDLQPYFCDGTDSQIPVIRYNATVCDDQSCVFEIDMRACLDAETTDFTHGATACDKDFAAAAVDNAKINIIVGEEDSAGGFFSTMNGAQSFEIDLTVTNDNADAAPRLLLNDNNPSLSVVPGANCDSAPFDTNRADALYCYQPSSAVFDCPLSGAASCHPILYPIFAVDLIDDELAASMWKLTVLGVDAYNDVPALFVGLADESLVTPIAVVDGDQTGFEISSPDILVLRRALYHGIYVESTPAGSPPRDQFVRYTLHADGSEVGSKTIQLHDSTTSEPVTTQPPTVYPEPDSVL